MVREPWKSQGAGIEAGAGFDRYRVVQYLVRTSWQSQGAEVGAGAGLDRYWVV